MLSVGHSPAAGLNFIDLGLPAGAETASMNRGPREEAKDEADLTAEDQSAEASEGDGASVSGTQVGDVVT